ncbi:oxygenase MpaB family protein [Flaviaesturariibacter amylovorans]|uniref:ER-bound oxygenase mpaB/mpaB'/Rubber oxygenase catalytic domain-containing protein n=1 Tax=Flaviaesturariibacter amylovorans TaxID=1084520 RepID=A0ABP8GGU0_9BACT
MADYVPGDNIVRQVWGRSETVLFIFAGASAEFALNKAVDWLYFTGRLPADPLGRLFSTVQYARRIVFSEKAAAEKAIDTIAAIHKGVEAARGAVIPDWAYRDVLYLLIHYSVAAFELIERPMTDPEKDDLYAVFLGIGLRMGLKELPPDYAAWLPSRAQHLRNDLVRSKYTDDLYRQYRRQLGGFRYTLLREVQVLLVPASVRELLGLRRFSPLRLAVPLYKLGSVFGIDRFIRLLLLPKAYKAQIDALDVHPPSSV